MNRILLLLLVVAGATVALAEDAKAKAAREELERQLSQMVGKQPTKVRVDYVSIDDPNYALEEASFELDGRSLGAPSTRQLSDEGTHLVWNGDVSPGKHTVKVRLVFANGVSVVMSDEGGYKWKVGGEVSFDVQSGIEVRVQVTPKRDPKQPDIAKRFRLSLPAQPVMLARLDDGKMPEPPPKPVLEQAVDAGTPVVVAAVDPKVAAAEEKKRKAEEAAEAKRLAAEAKKQKAEEAAEAKRLAAEAKKQKAAEALEAKRLAAEEKKQKAAEALEAKRLAAEEKQREAQAKALAAKETAEEKARLESEKEQMLANAIRKAGGDPDAGGAPVDAGTAVAVAEPALDAGAPAIVAVAPVDAGVPTAPVASAEEAGPPWAIIGGAGGLAAVIFLVVVARRRSRPPTLED